MRKQIVFCGLATLCLFVGADAWAVEGAGFYVGAGVGRATSQALDDFKASDTSFRMLAGYSFMKYLAVEAVYLDAGTAKDTIGPYALELETSSLIVSAVGTWSIGRRYALSAKLGYAFYEADQTIRLGDLSASSANSDQNFAGSFAAAFHFTQRYSVRAEYEAILLDEGKFGNLSVSGIVRF